MNAVEDKIIFGIATNCFCFASAALKNASQQLNKSCYYALHWYITVVIMFQWQLMQNRNSWWQYQK